MAVRMEANEVPTMTVSAGHYMTGTDKKDTLLLSFFSLKKISSPSSRSRKRSNMCRFCSSGRG